jgi:hypothetical protein
MRSITSVSIFDQNIVRTSPAGSCVLRIVEALAGDIPLHLYANRTDAPESKLVRKTENPLPPGPMGRRLSISISTEVPSAISATSISAIAFFCTSIAYSIGGGAPRRTARILNHTSAAFTERIAFRSARIIVARQGSLRGFSERCAAISIGLGCVHILFRNMRCSRWSACRLRRPVAFARHATLWRGGIHARWRKRAG